MVALAVTADGADAPRCLDACLAMPYWTLSSLSAVSPTAMSAAASSAACRHCTSPCGEVHRMCTVPLPRGCRAESAVCALCNQNSILVHTSMLREIQYSIASFRTAPCFLPSRHIWEVDPRPPICPLLCTNLLFLCCTVCKVAALSVNQRVR